MIDNRNDWSLERWARRFLDDIARAILDDLRYAEGGARPSEEAVWDIVDRTVADMIAEQPYQRARLADWCAVLVALEVDPRDYVAELGFHLGVAEAFRDVLVRRIRDLLLQEAYV